MLLGCSFAGLEFLYQLAKRAGRFRPGEMTVVDPRPRHSYMPLVHEVASGARSAYELTFDSPAFVRSIGGAWVTGEAVSLDPANHTVTLDGGRTLDYDRCAIAVGSVSDAPPQLLGSEGVVAAKWVSDAIAVREQLHRIRAAGARRAHVVVAGGALTAVEWGAELAAALVDAARVDVTLLGASPRLLREFHPVVGRLASGILEAMGVKVIFGQSVMRHSNRTAHTLDGGEHPADLLVWAGGVRPNPVLEHFGVPLGDDGRVIVTPRLTVKGRPGLYAIGDAAQIVESGMSWPTMQRAIEAIWQGTTLARRFHAGSQDDRGPSHRLRPDFWYGLSLGAEHSAAFSGRWITEHRGLVRGRRLLQRLYYRRFRL